MAGGILSFDITLTRGDFRLTACAELPLSGVTAIKGPSGAGKTSLLRVIAGLEPEARGQVRLQDTLWQGAGRFVPPQKRRIGYVFQNTRLFPHLSVAGNLAYGWQRRGRPAEVLERVIGALDLEPLLGRRIEGLSGGEQQRVAIGRALASDPQLLLLDEPLSGLDSSQRGEVLGYLSHALRQARVPALYVSHFEREINRIANRVLCIAGGRSLALHRLPAPLPARVIGRTGSSMQLMIAGQSFALPMPPAAVGNEVALRVLAQDVMVSCSDPGVSSALLVLPGRVKAILSLPSDACAGGRKDLQVALAGAGWAFDLPLAESVIRRIGLDAGRAVWVSFGPDGLLPVAGALDSPPAG